MKRIIVLIIGLASITGGCAQGMITTINTSQTQLDFGYHLMMVHFNLKPPDDRFDALITGVELTEARQQQLAGIIRDELLSLPEVFVARYVVDKVYFAAVRKKGSLGFHIDNRIILEARESLFNIRRTFIHEIAHEVADKADHTREYQQVISFFDRNRSLPVEQWHLSVEALYASGYTSAYSPASAKEEFCEMIADLLVPQEKHPAMDYILKNPDSLLARKAGLILDFFRKNYVKEFTQEYFTTRMSGPARNLLVAKDYGIN